MLFLTEAIITIKIYAGCDCQHRTAGSNCEVCESLYNNASYMRGTINDSNACQSMQFIMLKYECYLEII